MARKKVEERGPPANSWPVLLMVPVAGVVMTDALEEQFVALLKEHGVRGVGVCADPDLIREVLKDRFGI